MPIDRWLYPKNWQAIAASVKAHAQWCCKAWQKPCLRPDEALINFMERIRIGRLSECPVVAAFLAHPRRWLLTVAHLNQTPAKSARAKLKALCTVFHLRLDQPYRQRQRYAKQER